MFGFAALLVIAPLLASAHGHNRYSNGHRNHHAQTSQVPKTPRVQPPSQTPQQLPSSPSPVAGEVLLTAYITGYSYWDNTPPGSADISNGIIHSKAAGTGTYSDPITLAVGHSISGGKDTLDYPAGTIFYVPNLRRYAIVEDTCGDGNTPQNGPCHTGYQGHPWIDIYVGGGSVTRSISDNCMDAITEVHTVILNPAANYPVVSGEIAGNCTQYGEVI